MRGRFGTAGADAASAGRAPKSAEAAPDKVNPKAPVAPKRSRHLMGMGFLPDERCLLKRDLDLVPVLEAPAALSSSLAWPWGHRGHFCCRDLEAPDDRSFLSSMK